jgi:hypothetical protein
MAKIFEFDWFKAGMSNSNCSAGQTFSFVDGKIASGQQIPEYY